MISICNIIKWSCVKLLTFDIIKWSFWNAWMPRFRECSPIGGGTRFRVVLWRMHVKLSRTLLSRYFQITVTNLSNAHFTVELCTSTYSIFCLAYTHMSCASSELKLLKHQILIDCHCHRRRRLLVLFLRLLWIVLNVITSVFFNSDVCILHHIVTISMHKIFWR